MVYVDISKVSKILKRSILWNVNKPALVSFYRKDYHGNPSIPLDEAVRNTIYEKTGKKIGGPIRILTHLRYFGFCFNPVSFYYCFNSSDSKLEMIMAEVTNTPWNERYSYIIDKKMLNGSKKNLVAELEKKLHVSPFWGMDHQYEWLFSEPDESLLVNMKNFKSDIKVFDATLTMKRKPLTIKNLLIYVLRFPFMTLRVVYRIHWQALKLWVKKAPFFIHPSKIES